MSCTYVWTTPEGATMNVTREEYERLIQLEDFKNTENVLQKEFDKIANSPGRESSITSMIDNVSKLIRQVKIAFPDTRKLVAQDINLENSVNRLRAIDKNRLREAINEAKTMLSTVSEFNTLGKYLISASDKIKDDPNRDIKDKFMQLRSLMDYHNSIKAISNELETFFLKELERSNPMLAPLFKQFDEINAHNKILNLKTRDVFEDFLVDDLYSEVGDGVKAGRGLADRAQFFEASAKRAEDKGRKKEAAEYRQKALAFKDRTLTKEEFRAWLKGQRGDANRYSMLFEAAVMTSDPIVSSFRKKLNGVLAKARKFTIQEVADPMQTLIDKFQKATGRTKVNSKKFNEGLYEVVKTYSFDPFKKQIVNGVEIEGMIVEDETVQLNKWWDITALTKVQAEKEEAIWRAEQALKKYKIENRNNLDKATLNTFQESLDILQKDYTSWKNEHLQNRYTKAYYDIEKLKTQEATEALRELTFEIEYLENELYNNYTVRLERELFDLEKKRSNLYSDIDLNGFPKTGQDLRISQSLFEYSKARQEMYKPKTPEDEALAMENFKKHESNFLRYITNEKLLNNDPDYNKNLDRVVQRWYMRNSRRKIDQSWYDRRKQLTEELSLLMKDSEEVRAERNALYKELFALTGPYRDSNKVIQGNLFTKEEAAKIKDISEKIEALKETEVDPYSGFSKADRTMYFSMIKKRPHGMTIPEYIEDPNNGLTEDETYFLLNYYSYTNREEDEEQITKEQRIASIFQELSEMQQNLTTEYYQEEFIKQHTIFRKDWMAKNNLTENTITSEDEQKISADFENGEWYVANHATVLKYSREDKLYREVKEPLYIWLEKIPSDTTLIKDVQPAWRYYKTGVKDEFINFSRETNPFTEESLPERGGIFDKNSTLYIGTNKNYPTDPNVLEALEGITALYSKYQAVRDPKHRLGYVLPAVEKHWVEKVAEGDVTPASQWETFKRKWIRTEQDLDQGIATEDIDEIANIKEFHTLPLRFTKNMDVTLQTYDLWGAIAKFGQDSYLREGFSEVLGEAKTLLQVVRNQNPTEQSITDKKISPWSVFNPFSTIQGGRNVRAEHIEEIIRTMLFGEFSRAEKVLNIDMQKVVGNLNKLASWNTLAWAIPGAVTNWLSAKTQSTIEKFAGDYLSKQDIVKGYSLYKQRLPEMFNDGIKLRDGNNSPIGKMILYWDALQGNDEDFGEQIGVSKIKNAVKSNFFGMYLRQAGEHEAQLSVWMSLLNKQGLSVTKDNVTKTITALEFYEMLAKEDILSVEDLPSNMSVTKSDGSPWTIKEERNLILLNGRINAELNGEYSKWNKNVAQKYAAFKAISFFRKYFIPMATRRFSGYKGPRMNIGTDDYREGYYITFTRHILLPLLKGRISQFRFAVMAAYRNDGTMSPKDVANLKRMTAEITLILSMAFFIKAVGGGDDEDQDLDKHSFAALYAIFWAKKVKSETEQFLPLPGLGWGEISNLYHNPAIAVSQLDKHRRIIDDAFLYLTGDDKAYTDSDQGMWDEGSLKFNRDILKLIGITGTTWHPDQLIKNFEYGQRNR